MVHARPGVAGLIALLLAGACRPQASATDLYDHEYLAGAKEFLEIYNRLNAAKGPDTNGPDKRLKIRAWLVQQSKDEEASLSRLVARYEKLEVPRARLGLHRAVSNLYRNLKEDAGSRARLLEENSRDLKAFTLSSNQRFARDVRNCATEYKRLGIHNPEMEKVVTQISKAFG